MDSQEMNLSQKMAKRSLALGAGEVVWIQGKTLQVAYPKRRVVAWRLLQLHWSGQLWLEHGWNQRTMHLGFIINPVFIKVYSNSQLTGMTVESSNVLLTEATAQIVSDCVMWTRDMRLTSCSVSFEPLFGWRGLSRREMVLCIV